MVILQKNGFFPTIDINTRAVGTENFDFSELTYEEIYMLNKIANNPVDVLQEISNEEDGEAQLAFIATMLSEDATIGELYEAMFNVDPAMAYEYKLLMEEEFGQITSRAVIGESIDIFSIKLAHTMSPFEDNARGIMANDLEWNTIVWYIGYCAVATAGMITYRAAPFFKPWLKAVGLGVAAGGFVLMTTQLVRWYSNNNEIKELANALKAATN
jgi:hypothetical protein